MLGERSKRKPLFHTPHKLIVGNSPLVGVLDLPGTIKLPPIRLFFPATSTTGGDTVALPKPASYFVGNRVSYVLQGFAALAFARHTTNVYRWLFRPICWLLSLVFPVRYLTIPGTTHVRSKDDASVVKYAPPIALQNENATTKEDDEKNEKQKLCLFSHGLTGTGEENSVFCTALAKRGYVVASIHHRDGSSCRVPLSDGTCRYYEHMPSGDDYNPRDRLEQVHTRAKELLYTCSWLMGEEEPMSSHEGVIEEDQRHIIVDQIRPHLDKLNIIAAGFSYGATTVSLAASLFPDKFQKLVLLDPWLHIDYSSRGVEFDFPPEAFGNGWPEMKDDATTDPTAEFVDTGGADCEKEGLSTPSIFISSSQFHKYEKLYSATQRLANKINSHKKGDTTSQNPRAEMYVIPGTRHQNFCDVIFWLPRRLSNKIFRLGDADAYEAYESILDRTIQFLERF